jgi:hypothetical protein
MPEAAGSFRFTAGLDQNHRNEWNKMRQMSLVQRANGEKSAIPPLTSRGTVAFQISKSKVFWAPESAHATRHTSMPDFICERREVFRIQLMIQRKCAEMSELANEVEKEKQRFLDSERSNEYKLKSAHAEALVAHARKECETATRRRMDIQKQYQLTRQRVSLTRAQISKNQNAVDDYHR